MKCTTAGCQGEYREKLISQMFTCKGQSVVIEDIPAMECDVCGDILIDPEVVEQLMKIGAAEREPIKFAPVFKFEAVATS